MADITINHIFTNPVADGTVTSIVRPSDWNSVHAFSARVLDRVGVSTGGNTAGNTGLTYGSVIFQGGNSITLSQSTAAGSLATILVSAGNYLTTAMASNRGSDFVQANAAFNGTNASGTIASNAISVSVAAQSNQSAIRAFGASNTGNTAGNTGVSTGIDWVLAGSNNVTISESTAGGGPNTIWVSGPTITRNVASNAIQSVGSATGSGTNTSRFAADDHVHAGVFSMGVTNAGNTVGDTRVDVGRFVLQGGNNITLSQITAANALNTIILSGANAGGAQTGISGVGVSDTTYTSGTVIFSAQANVTLGSSVDGASQYVRVSVAAGGGDAIRGIAANGSTASTNTVNFSDANGISFGFGAAGNSTVLTASHNALTSQSNQNVTAGNGGFAFQTLSFSNVNGFSFGTSAGSAITGSYTVPTQTNQTLGIYVTAQSTGQSSSSTYDARTISIVPDGIISAGWSNGSFRISATQSNQAVSNSAGSFTFQTLNFSNANNVTWGTSAGGIVTASVAAPGAAVESNPFNLLGANTAGNTTATGSTIGLSGINLTLSGTNNSVINLSAPATSSLVGASGISISTNGSTISVYDIPISAWDNYGDIITAGTAQGNSLVSIQPFRLDDVLAFSEVRLWASFNVATAANNSSAFQDVTAQAVIYTRNVSTLSSVFSTSGSFTRTWSSNASQTVTGVAGLNMTHAGSTLTPGSYWVAFHLSTTNSATGGAATTALTHAITMGLARSIASAAQNAKLWGGQTANSYGLIPGLGVISTGATRGTIAFSDYTMTGTRAFLAPLAFALNNQTFQ